MPSFSNANHPSMDLKLWTPFDETPVVLSSEERSIMSTYPVFGLIPGDLGVNNVFPYICEGLLGQWLIQGSYYGTPSTKARPRLLTIRLFRPGVSACLCATADAAWAMATECS
ncbi:4673_t:CDS:1, partial [Acaulospora colombiana]